MKAVIFDLDDTLVDTRAAFGAAVDAGTRVLVPDLTPDQSQQALASWRADVGGHYRAYTRGELGYWEQREARLLAITADLGIQAPNPQQVQEWNDTFDEAFSAHWSPFADTRASVDALVGAGYLVGVLTNAQRTMQEAKLAATGLADIPLLVTLDTFGIGKPAPEVFLEACRLLDVAPAQAAYVGDELDLDARGARAAGLHGIWLDRPGHRRGNGREEDADAARADGLSVLTGLHEVHGLISSL